MITPESQNLFKFTENPSNKEVQNLKNRFAKLGRQIRAQRRNGQEELNELLIQQLVIDYQLTLHCSEWRAHFPDYHPYIEELLTIPAIPNP